METLTEVIYREFAGSMLMEGTCDIKPSKDTIREFARKDLWKTHDIGIVYDEYQGYWLFNTIVTPLGFEFKK